MTAPVFISYTRSPARERNILNPYSYCGGGGGGVVVATITGTGRVADLCLDR